MARQYGSKLAIVIFSGDASRKMWLDSVNRDEPSWLSLWDGKGINSETSLKYGVSGYPNFFLIDTQGKLVAVKDGYGTGALREMMQSAKF